MTLNWTDWTIDGVHLGFRGNPDPGSTERAECVAEAKSDEDGVFHWHTAERQGRAGTPAEVVEAVEAAIGGAA